MKIAIFEADRECRKLFSQLPVDVDTYEKPVQEVVKRAVEYEAISIFVHSKIDEKCLQFFPKLRYIQTRSTGYDHIDLQACNQRGIVVSHVRGYAGPPVGEFAFSLLLNHSRHTFQALSRTKATCFEYKDLLGFELFQKRLGIVGLGTIGKHIAKIAHGFGMEIMAYSRSYDEDFMQRYHIQRSDLSSLLRNSDAIVFAVPLTPQTYHMLNEENVDLIKRDAVVINIARGEIISPLALENLARRIYGLGLDVIEDEKEFWQKKPKAMRNLIQQEQMLYTPHMAYYTKEALQRIREISYENMIRFIENRQPKYVVNG